MLRIPPKLYQSVDHSRLFGGVFFCRNASETLSCERQRNISACAFTFTQEEPTLVKPTEL